MTMLPNLMSDLNLALEIKVNKQNDILSQFREAWNSREADTRCNILSVRRMLCATCSSTIFRLAEERFQQPRAAYKRCRITAAMGNRR